MSEPGNQHSHVVRTHRLRRMSGRDPHEPHRVATPLALASAGVSTPVCLLVVTAAPVTVVVGYEWQGRHRTAAALARSESAVDGRP